MKQETKKPSARTQKSVQRASAKPTVNGTTILAKELRSLIPKLDAEGLQFLIEQAQIHLYNMQVDELNRATERDSMARSSKEHRTIAQSAGKANAEKSKIGDKIAPNSKNADGIRIEGAESGSSFYIVYRGQWIMFSRDEIAQMTKIVRTPVTELERREHLFDWFERERRDVFATVPIADKFDERLKKIMGLLGKGFRGRQG